MSTQLKNLLAFNLIPGASVVLTHELNNGAIPVEPDVIWIPTADLAVTLVTDTTFTLTNQGGTDLVGSVLVEAWHTIERAFGDAATLDLTPKPYIFVGSEVSGSTPQPAFQDPPLTITIYARLTGNDTTGTGTLANPYRTFQRAIRDVPNFIPPGVFYYVDITGIGVETLPDDFILPSWKSAFAVTGYDHDNPFFYGRAAVRIAADPVPATTLSAANRVINAAVQTPDAATGLTTVTDATKTWVPGELVGLFAVGNITPGVPFSNNAKAPILSNDATSFVVPRVTGFFGDAFVLPITIMELSATLEGNNVTPSFGNGAIASQGQDSLAFQGVRIQPSAAAPAGVRGILWSGGTSFVELCHIVEGTFRGLDFLQFTSCIVEGAVLQTTDAFGLFNRFVGGLGGTEFNMNTFAVFEVAFQECNPVGARDSFVVGNGLITDALSDGVGFGDAGTIFGCEINDAVDNAVHANNGANYGIFGVVGTGNGGVGIRVNNGAQVATDADDAVVGPQTTVTGTDDQQVGDLAAAAYPAAPFNIYDITAVGAGGATGTGARLHS